MSFLVYQRADPRYPDWLPLETQQVRLRNLLQVIGVNLNVRDHDHQVYYTLHLSPMSAPFYTSEKVPPGPVVSWREIEPRRIPSFVPLSAPGFIIRVWSVREPTKPLTSWGVNLKALHYLGAKANWNTQDFAGNSLLFRMPYGFFTAQCCLQQLSNRSTTSSNNSERYFFYSLSKPLDTDRKSYTVTSLARLHDVQRSVLEEVEEARKQRLQISYYGYSSDPEYTMSTLLLPQTEPADLKKSRKSTLSFNNSATVNPVLSGKALLRVQQGKQKLQLKEEIEAMRLQVALLRDEKARSEGRVLRLKQKAKGLDDSAGDLMARVHTLGRERDRLTDFKVSMQDKMHGLAERRSSLNLRKKQLISELLLIYPLQLVEGSKKYSVAEVQLPNAEDYGNETGGQVSVALGYTAHLVAMLSFFLGIPLRYPIRHFGSRSRIIDHITTQIPNKEREFPLYFRGREDVYSKYAVYLLNKNIAQIRWYCGLSTPDLRATLPNLFSVLTSRLIIPGWPPSPAESCELAEELTEETHHQMFRTDMSLSLDEGLNQISDQPKAVDQARMQSWLRASFSDLECAGGNSVPVGELQHGRAQNRFLSGWKKKTYSESEDVDPVWLTNSLNLELDLGGGRFSAAASAPVLLPHITVSNEANKDSLAKARKRRFGRVESLNPFSIIGSMSSSSHSNNSSDVTSKQPEGQVASTPASMLLTIPDNLEPYTPNRSMNDIEQQIIANERRKSVVCCDAGRLTSPTHAHGPFHFTLTKDPSSVTSDVPVVDNYPTTDDERVDDGIVDVVRRLSFMDVQMKQRNRGQTVLDTLVENSPTHMSSPRDVLVIDLMVERSSGGDHESGPGDADSSAPGGEGQLHRVTTATVEHARAPTMANEVVGEEQLDFFSSCDGDDVGNVGVGSNDGTAGISNSHRTTQCDPSRGNNNNIIERGNTCGGKIELSSNPVNDQVVAEDVGGTSPNQSDFGAYESNCDSDDVEVRMMKRGNHVKDLLLGKEDEMSKCGLKSTLNNCGSSDDDTSSLWFRTEALLGSTSFNMVKRRMSESN